MSSFRVRLRLPSKQETLTLSPPVSIRALLEGVQSHVGGDISQIGLKLGYPPKQVDLGDSSKWDEDVSTIGIKNGETLIVTTSEPSEETEPELPESKPVATAAAAAGPVKRNFTTFQDTISKESSENVPMQRNTPSPPKRGRPSAQDEPPEISVEGGSVVMRIMADDNSCMFNALIYCVGRNVFKAPDLRQIVARSIKNDPERFNDATLGRPVNEYCAWITRANSWGGEIELAILSEHFQVGIDCVDVKNQHVYSYGESYPTRCILVYSGIHYDALAYTFIPEMPDADVTVYEMAGEPPYASILAGAKTMARKLKERGYNVDTATFNIVCEQCGKGFIGEKEAIKHASETGHTAFGQIPAEEDG